MTTNFLGALIIALLGLLGFAPPMGAEDGDTIRLLRTGTFHANEVEARDGETWLALYSDDYGFILKPVTLSIDTVYDPVLDDDPTHPTGKRVAVQGSSLPDEQKCSVLSSRTGQKNLALSAQQPVLLLQGIKTSKTGRLMGGGTEPNTFLYPGQVLEIPVSNRYYQVMAYGDVRQDNTIRNYQLTLWQEDQFHPVLTIDRLSLIKSARPQILWAGDLNGDQRLDLLIEQSDHHNVSQWVLLLSTEKDDPLLKPVASFRTRGC